MLRKLGKLDQAFDDAVAYLATPDLIRSKQESLARLGLYKGTVDSKMNDDLRAAIKLCLALPYDKCREY